MKISVICPTYNRKFMLQEAIGSFLSQNFKNAELLVIDDGSTDGTNIMMSNKFYDNLQIKYFIKENGGISSAVNFGIKEASGDLICELHDDDKLCEKSLEKRVEVFKRIPELEVLWTSAIDIDKQNKVIGEHIALVPDKDRIWKEDYIYMPTMMWKKDIHKKIGLFSEDLLSNEDWEFKIKCMMECKCSRILEKTIFYRRHNGNKSTVNTISGILQRCEQIMFKRLNKRYGR